MSFQHEDGYLDRTKCDLFMPTLCRVLEAWQPTTTNWLPDHWEFEVVVEGYQAHARLRVRTTAEDNLRLRLLMVLQQGVAGGWLRVGGDTRRFGEDGSFQVFDPSFDLELGNLDDREELWFVSITLPHPGYSEAVVGRGSVAANGA